MRCRACDYELWHCTGRTCPECGEEFSLREFEFELGAVLFHCPHCDHGEEGIGTNGWPDLTIEQCSICGLAIGLDYFVVRPIAGAGSESLGVSLPIHSKDGSWFAGRFFKTIWLIMTKPGRTMGRIPVHEPLAKAWAFLLTTVIISFAIALIPMLFLFAFPLFSYGGPQGGPGVTGIFLVIGIEAIFVFVLMLLFVLVWAAMSHAILLLTGGCSFTFRRTMQAILYSGGASIVNVVPCVGGIAGTVWWIVSAINMVSRGQRVSGGRASVAVLGAPLVFILCVCGGYSILIFGAVSQANTASKQFQQSPQVLPTEEELATDQEAEE
ncbi:YIP1 family protein [PVC group bacterium]|nr:YIP1 family protein [PVC group bacterium]